MIYSAAQKPTSRGETTQDSSSSRIAQEIPTKAPYGNVPLSKRRLPNVEESFDFTGTQAEALAECILHRIETRLPCRVRKLQVFVTENEVVLEGQCSTYYTKQIAQHTAMGVLEYEQLVNRIVVCATK